MYSSLMVHIFIGDPNPSRPDQRRTLVTQSVNACFELQSNTAPLYHIWPWPCLWADPLHVAVAAPEALACARLYMFTMPKQELHACMAPYIQAWRCALSTLYPNNPQASCSSHLQFHRHICILSSVCTELSARAVYSGDKVRIVSIFSARLAAVIPAQSAHHTTAARLGAPDAGHYVKPVSGCVEHNTRSCSLAEACTRQVPYYSHDTRSAVVSSSPHRGQKVKTQCG